MGRLWSGVTAYWLLTRHRARIRESDQHRLASATGANQLASYYYECLQQNEMVPIRSLNPKVDAGMAAIIVERCLKISPLSGTSSMEDVLQDLSRRRRGQRLHSLKPWSTSYLLRWALGRRSFQVGLLVLALIWPWSLYTLDAYRQRQFDLLTQSGLHALESGRTEEAYLRWLGALGYEPGDATTRARLSFLPVLMTYPNQGEVSSLAYNQDGSLLWPPLPWPPAAAPGPVCACGIARAAIRNWKFGIARACNGWLSPPRKMCWPRHRGTERVWSTTWPGSKSVFR